MTELELQVGTGEKSSTHAGHINTEVNNYLEELRLGTGHELKRAASSTFHSYSNFSLLVNMEIIR
jgi:hypothetical protein